MSNDAESSEEHQIVPTRKSYCVPASNEGADLSKLVKRSENALVLAAEETSKAKLSPESRAVIQQFLNQNSRGYAGSLPMICSGNECPFISACPLAGAGSQLPFGQRCPVEHNLVQMWVDKHLIALGIKDVYAPENSFDMDMLYELASQQLIKWRCGVHLSDAPALIARENVGSNQVGEPIFQDVINPVLEIMDRCGKNVSKLREALLATRKAQIQAGKDMTDPSKTVARLRLQALEKLKVRMEGGSETVKDAEYEVKEDE